MHRAGRVFAVAGLILLGLVLAVVAAWGALALLYAGPGNETMRMALAGIFSLSGLAAVIGLFFRRQRFKAVLAYAALFAGLLIWWGSIEPSNHRDWQPEVARLAYAEINGDLITVRNIRNFDYRTETDFTPAYYDKTFELQDLAGVDVVASYWMGPDIAHV